MKSIKKSSFHESFERDEEIVGSSNRAFGIVFSVVFSLIGFWPLLSIATPRWWAIIIAVFFLIASVVKPQLLAPANTLWTKFGLLLHRVTNPIIMGFLFFIVITPMGLVRRMVVRDPLSLKRCDDVDSYWIHRPAPQPESSMEKQF